MAPECQVGQREMKCILKFEKYFHMSQCYSGERCGPWASCCRVIQYLSDEHIDTYNYFYMKWLSYQRVISLKMQVGNANQRNKWANTDPRIYRRWDQVPRRSKHPMLIDHTRREPSSMIMNAELSAVKVRVSSTVYLLVWKM
jgi:hypothetical protein